MHLHCPQCNSSDLRRASLAYQEGLHRVNTRMRIIGFLIGSDGPGIFAGNSRTTGFHQTDLSKLLNPPVKWSYGKLLLWGGILSIFALIAFVIHVNSAAPPVSSLPVKLYVVFGPIFLGLLTFTFWRHNRLTYRARYIEWERSFICQRCGAVSVHDVPHSSHP
jgi:hypothetical protein